MNRRARLRDDAAEDKSEHLSSDVENETGDGSSVPGTNDEGVEDSSSSRSNSASDDDDDSDSDAVSNVSSDFTPPKEDFKDISFGALAEAQAAFPPKSRKRKATSAFSDDEDNASTHPSQPPPARSAPLKLSAPPKPQSRTSKHAPTILSSKNQVSRHRTIFSPPRSLQSRDPRFDPTIQHNTHTPNALSQASKNYSFLTTYQASEILNLKSQISKTTDPQLLSSLKRQVMSIESKLRNAESQRRQREIMQEHKRSEKAALAAGAKAKPYYLKESDVKKIAKQERLEGMSKKARDKADARKQKREKSKDAKGMPRVRRE